MRGRLLPNRVKMLNVRCILSAFFVILCCNVRFVSAEEAGFTASVSGAMEAQVSGPGLFFEAPVYESAAVKRPEYFVIANVGGVRENGITFSVPSGQQGTCQLTDGTPFEIGRHCEVRVELGSATDYFNKQTTGTLNLASLPVKAGDGLPVQGEFEFEVSNKEGKRIAVKGQFNFIPPDSVQR